MNSVPLRELGWQPFFDAQVSADDLDNEILARVSAHHGSQIVFMTPGGEVIAPSSIIEVDKEEGEGVSTIAVGDWFLLNSETHRAIRRLERKTSLMRKAAGAKVKSQLIAANVETVFIVTSCNLDFNLSRIERYLALILESGATPIVVLTKADLHSDPVELRQLAEALHPGLIVETLDARDPEQASVLEDWCGIGETVALLGSSGVGKSTLANAMGNFEIKTSGIREGDDKGRHTTTARSMHRLKAGGWLIDNPGMRELQLPDCEQGVAELFEDIVELATKCKFNDCSHQGDAGCALTAAIEDGTLDERRVRNFMKLRAEQAHNASTLAERRAKFRKFGKECKQIMQEKKNRRYGS